MNQKGTAQEKLFSFSILHDTAKNGMKSIRRKICERSPHFGQIRFHFSQRHAVSISELENFETLKM